MFFLVPQLQQDDLLAYFVFKQFFCPRCIDQTFGVDCCFDCGFIFSICYESIATVGEIRVYWRADFQSVKKGVLNLFLSISMAYNVISCQKVAENAQILKIAKFAM